jgi:hypothetical protein
LERSNISKIYSHYLDKYAENHFYSAYQGECPDLITVIPAYNELNLRDALTSLYECDNESLKIIVIVVFNYSENDNNAVRKRNRLAWDETTKMAEL